jgi:hypothetical protein
MLNAFETRLSAASIQRHVTGHNSENEQFYSSSFKRDASKPSGHANVLTDGLEDGRAISRGWKWSLTANEGWLYSVFSGVLTPIHAT